MIKATSVGRFFLSSDCNSGEYMQKLGLKEFLIAALYVTAIDSNPAEAADIFEYQGSSHRATGGAGLLFSGGGEAVIHNPAGIASSKNWSLDFDLGLLNLTYSIFSPDPNVKPGQISIPVIPLVSFGLKRSISNTGLSFGFFAFPTGIGSEFTVDDFPVTTAGVTQNVDVSSKQTGFKVGAGVGYKTSIGLNFGVSVLYDYQDSENTAQFSDGNRANLTWSSQFVRPIIGLRYKQDLLGNLSFKYEPPTYFSYDLSLDIGTGPQASSFENYRPEVFAIGYYRRIKRFIPFITYAYEKWVDATYRAKPATSASNTAAPIEYLDTNNFTAGISYIFSRSSVASISYAQFDGNKGLGAFDENGEVAFAGISAQDFEALSRRHVTLSFLKQLKSGVLRFYGTHIYGATVAPEDSPSAGFYEIEVYLLGASYKISPNSKKKKPKHRIRSNKRKRQKK
jgi:hypothetical protein